MEQNKKDPVESQAQPIRLLRTKLFVPRAHPDLVGRLDLLARLSQGLTRKLTLVIAPAGFGKSTLVSAWAATLPDPPAWVSLDDRDNDPIRFWSYFIAALQTRVESIGEVALNMLRVATPPPIETILTELVNDVTGCPDSLVVVLDDYHVIETRAIHQGLIFFLEHLPPQLHLVIASRNDPPFPLPLMRGRRELVELSLTNLRFTNKEAVLFFNQCMGLELNTSDIDRLVSLTEGWIAGLQMAALSIQETGNADGIIQSFSGSHRFIFDYLAQEVHSRQPAQVRAFLLQSAGLDRFCGPLLDAVLGREFFRGSQHPFPDSQSILEYLERSNLFIVELDQQRQWYRYHHLFSDFLKARFSQEFGDDRMVQHNLRASEWFEKNGLMMDAIKYALAARHYARMAYLIILAMDEFYAQNELSSAINWIRAIPKNEVRLIPELCMNYAWILLATSQMEYVEENLHFIEESLGMTVEAGLTRSDLNKKQKGTLAEILCIRSNLAFHRMDLDQTVRLSRQALELLSPEVTNGLINSRDSMLSVAQFNLAMAEEFRGDIPSASESFEKTLKLSLEAGNYNITMFAYSHLAGLAVIQGNLNLAEQTYLSAIQKVKDQGVFFSPIAGIAMAGLGGIYYKKNRFDEAENYLVDGIKLGKQWANWEILLPAYLTLARLKEASGNPDQAMQALDELESFGSQSQVSWGLPLVQANRALFWARHGDSGKAREWLESHPLQTLQSLPIMAEAEGILRLHLLAACEDYPIAADLAEKLITKADAGKRSGRAIEILAISSLVQYAMGNEKKAHADIEKALSQAIPEGDIRLFVDLGQPMKLLLISSLDQKGRLGEIAGGVKIILALFEGHKTQVMPVPTDNTDLVKTTKGSLTERELDVLHLMASGYTNQEIADRLVVSLNTVKSHVKSILGQLEVSNRTQATARARELGLL